MKNVEELFIKYQNLIRSVAWKYAKAWDMDVTEVESEGYLIFMEILDTFDESRNIQFSTYLYHSLRKLQDFCAKYTKGWRETLPLWDESAVTSDYAENRPDLSFDCFCRMLDRTEAATYLSEDAKEILTYLLSEDWRIPGNNRKPSWNSVMKEYRKRGWFPARTRKAWKELENWWNMAAMTHA